jgi:hypothetical protein
MCVVLFVYVCQGHGQGHGHGIFICMHVCGHIVVCSA